jgi:SagB-type dehydrogenase family enzyme
VSTADVARSYHDRTAHTWRSVRAGGGQLDWGAQPLSVKVYPDLEPLRLPLDLVTSDWPALDALAGVWPPNRSPWSLQRVASLLFHTAGVTRRWERDGVPRAFRAAPSAGALYPVETYVVCGDLPGLEAGVHHFEPLSWTLRRLRDGDLRGTLAEAVVDEATAAAPLSVVLTGVPGRSTWKYRARGYRHVWWDAGAMVAHLLALADGLGEPARVLTGFLDRAVGALLGCDDELEHPLVVVPVGEPIGPPARPTATPRPLTHRHLPLLRRGGSDPELLAVHRTGDLPSRRAVFDWRESMRSLRLTTGTHEVEAPLLGAYDTIEDVVLRRGATRRFDRTPVPGDALRWPVSVADRPVPMDVLEPGDGFVTQHVVVSAVDDVEAGAHRLHRGDLELLRPGSFRGEATAMCLEQPLGGDAAYTVFHMAHLDRMLAGGGERAYRVAQLAGGIALGRVQLAAHALGLGATGLTFYDEDVRRFFGGEAEALCVSAVGVPAYDPRPGAPPAAAPPPRDAG